MLDLHAPNWWAAGAFVLAAMVFAIALRRYLRGRDPFPYDPKSAWLRAFAYFCVTWALACASGALPTVLTNPLVLAGQAGRLGWWVFTIASVLVVIVGYWIIWPIGTRAHGRRIVIPDTVLFGIAWGLSEGLLFASVWVVAYRVFGVSLGGRIGTIVVCYAVLSLFIGVWHARYWDIYIAPEHNVLEWNSRKVAFAHNPNIIVTTTYVTCYHNLSIYVLLQALALLGSTLAMPFPSFRFPNPEVDPDAAPMQDMVGRVCLVTGGANGIGRVVARDLAALGATVLVVDRQDDQGERTCSQIVDATGNHDVTYLHCDLSRPDEVRALANQVLTRYRRLDVLVNNAGLFAPEYTTTAEGHELMLATHHLGHFQLTQLLLERLQASAPARVLVVSSDAHKRAKQFDFDDMNSAALWGRHAVSNSAAFGAYARAKLAATATAFQLARETAGTGVTVNVLSPGAFVGTAIYDDMGGLSGTAIKMGRRLLPVPQEAARTYVFLATALDVSERTGLYWRNTLVRSASTSARDPELQGKLWDWTQSMISTWVDATD